MDKKKIVAELVVEYKNLAALFQKNSKELLKNEEFAAIYAQMKAWKPKIEGFVQTLNSEKQATTSLSGSVGKGGANKKTDVLLIQKLLNKKEGAKLAEDGDCRNKTIAAISAFQNKYFNKANGLIEVNGQSWAKLSGTAAPVHEAVIKEPEPKPKEVLPPTKEETAPRGGTAIPKGNIKKAVGKGQDNLPNDVLTVQSLLLKKGYSLTANGVYDAATEEAIIKFQNSIGNKKQDAIVSPKASTMARLLLSNLPPLGLPPNIKTEKSVIEKDKKNAAQAGYAQDIVVAAGPGLTANSPVLVLIGGMGGWTGSKMLQHCPSSIYTQAVVIAAGYTATWKQIEMAYQAYFKTTAALDMGSCGIMGFSAGGNTLYRWGFSKFKKVGLADPYITDARAKGLGSNAILSCNFVDWNKDRTTPKTIVEAATKGGAFVEETRVPHGEYPAYFLSQFGSDLI